MTESFGMMEGAFFVGKNDILKWINSTYGLNMSKIEHACTGALYCQIIDSIHPGKVKMHKVNWKAKLEHEFLPNYKILQQAFEDCKIAKNIDVGKLVKGKYQDNLEFLQWMKRYFEERTISLDYDPLLKRNHQDLEICNESNNTNQNKKRGDSKTHFNSNTLKSVKSSKNLEKVSDTSKSTVNNIKTVNLQEEQLNNLRSEFQEEKKEAHEIKEHHQEDAKEEHDKFNEATDVLRQHYQERLDIATDDMNKLKLEVSTLKISLSEIGNQRDFYFSKLRDIELLVAKNPNLEKSEFVDLIKNVLFAEKEVELLFDEKGSVELKNR